MRIDHKLESDYVEAHQRVRDAWKAIWSFPKNLVCFHFTTRNFKLYSRCLTTLKLSWIQ